MEIILASASPRRRELMRLLADEFKIIPALGEEITPKDLSPLKAPEYLASLKAREIAKKNPSSLVIGCDTAVFLGEKMLGKPKNREEAKQMLLSLSGKTHKVISGCALIYDGKTESFSSETEVEFFELTEAEIEAYLETGEGDDKAGSYGIQGKGSLFVKGIKGDYFNVVGFPVSTIKKYMDKIKNDA
jgi:septum formation protein